MDQGLGPVAAASSTDSSMQPSLPTPDPCCKDGSLPPPHLHCELHVVLTLKEKWENETNHQACIEGCFQTREAVTENWHEVTEVRV